MQQIYGAKVSVLTWGGLTEVLCRYKFAKQKTHAAMYDLNCQKSAEAILPFRHM